MDKRSSLAKRRVVTFLIIFLGPILVLGSWRFIGHLNSSEFCTSCHSMSFAHQEYKESRHFISRSGVRAGCSDCHVGSGGNRVFVLNQLMTCLWTEVRNPIKDKTGWEKRRGAMADRVRAKLGRDERSCIGCHDPEMMKPANERGRVAHERIRSEGMGCMECHRNLAHAEGVN